MDVLAATAWVELASLHVAVLGTDAFYERSVFFAEDGQYFTGRTLVAARDNLDDIVFFDATCHIRVHPVQG